MNRKYSNFPGTEKFLEVRNMFPEFHFTKPEPGENRMDWLGDKFAEEGYEKEFDNIRLSLLPWIELMPEKELAYVLQAIRLHKMAGDTDITVDSIKGYFVLFSKFR